MATDNIFSGLKVVDLASFVAGPGAATILSDFGADVIKIEPPEGDLWRKAQKVPPQPRSDEAYPFQLANRNKRGVALNLKAAMRNRFSSGSRSGPTCSSSTRLTQHARN
jgi:crotonobetainyl-CoA:carnitine CoA-transferase CaiB-like acyl-CoA transferase